MRALLRLAATSVAAASLLLGTLVAPAAAAGSPIDVTSVSVKPSYDGAAISAKTKYYQFTTRARVGTLTGWADIYGDVYRGSKKVASKVDLGYAYSGGKSLTGYIKAKSSWGRGTFQVKNVRVVYEGETYRDTSVSGGKFTMKSAIAGKLKYGHVIQVRADGKRKTVKVGVKQYTATKAWEPYAGKKVKIQYKANGTWKTKKIVRLKSNGQVTYQFSSGKRYKYRVLVPPSSTVVGGRTVGTPRL
ncbi:hypothetical protein BCE75_101259 [Isoptericola sp. CG 20/1183]|uniref:Uncharacterized protein n=1 Tax=Isoptericola halotolerans TaxID=300560 RepID=A0ABX5EJY1_9MICO|nr:MULTISPECIES: hypothetical protein [Isoptericola]MCK0118423.1 hypothetical protein [Isoptericola sp. S6320L]PRZ08621.1 hypothetical protein BCL65_102163 [Isoptericola halotolerans]PRZ10932.1 hypothetical protein BCE75_101259 [Isoptericola sp. CG 20/1183]